MVSGVSSVFIEADLVPYSIQNLPGVYVVFPEPRHPLDMTMDFGELFTVVDQRTEVQRAVTDTLPAAFVISRPEGIRSEGDFTSPSVWCPHPDRWSAYDNDSTEVEVIELLAALVRAIKPDFVLETGAAFGYASATIGRALAANGHGRLAALEVDPVRFAEAARRCSGLPVDVLLVDSLAWTPARPIQFAWLDSAIGIRHLELERFRRWFAPGAIVGIHDVGPQHSVRGLLDRAGVDEWFRRIHLRTPRGVLFGEVIA